MTLSDGRVVKGKFQCMDRLRNFILVDAEETRMVAITPGARAGDRARFEKIARPLSLTPRARASSTLLHLPSRGARGSRVLF